MSVSEAIDATLIRLGRQRPTLIEAISTIGTPAAAWPGTADSPDGSDQLGAIATVHVLAAQGPAEREELAALLSQETAFLREHAAWALGSGPLVPAALPGLVRLVTAGGFAGTVAQATLEAFATLTPSPVHDALARALADDLPAEPRARLVETVGLVPGVATTRILLDLALDPEEPPAVRAAAVAAVGDIADPVRPPGRGDPRPGGAHRRAPRRGGEPGPCRPRAPRVRSGRT